MRAPKLVAFVVVLAAVASTAHAGPYTGPWETIYSTDFSSNPGWLTNDPTNLYWNSAAGDYHYKLVNQTPSSVAYLPFSFDPQKAYKLDFDIIVNECDWAGGPDVGLSGPNMTEGIPPKVLIRYQRDDGGVRTFTEAADNGGGEYSALGVYFNLGTWYHNELVLDATGDTSAYFKITKVSDGSFVGDGTITGMDGFAGIDRIYIGSVDGHYAAGSTAEGFIDNVELSVATPEPVSLIFFGTGLVAVSGYMARRRRQQKA